MGGEAAERSARCILVLLCGLLAAACDPCFGTAACGRSLDVSASGQVIEFRSGKGVAGVELIFRRTGGIRLDEPEGPMTTDGDGLYSYRADALDTGSVTFSVTVRPPSLFPEYTVDGITITASAVRGEGQPLGRWLVNPYLAFVGEVRMLDTRGGGGSWRAGDIRTPRWDRYRPGLHRDHARFLRTFSRESGPGGRR